MANVNNTINATTTFGASPVKRTGFGVTVLLGLATFAEAIRYYGSYAEALPDAPMLTTAQLAGVQTTFSGSNQPTQVAVGKLGSISAPVAQVDTVTVSGNDAGDYTITITNRNGTDTVYTYSADGVETIADIATALAAMVDTSADVSASPTATEVVITSAYPGYGFTTAVTNADGNLAVANTTANTAGVIAALDTFLASVIASGDSFFGVCIDSRDDDVVEACGDWCAANGFLFSGQTSSADAIAGTLPNILSRLKAKNYNTSFVSVHSDDSERLDVGWITNKLSADPDTGSTTFRQFTVNGITPQAQFTATQISNIQSQNGNIYSTLFGVGSTDKGVLSSGNPIDAAITAAWMDARVEEDFAQALLNASNNNTKIPYTNDGINVFVGLTERRLAQGVRNDHFVSGTTEVTVLDVGDIDPATRRSRILKDISWSADAAGAIEEVTITGVITL